jgi:hypothetical protein
VCFGVVSESIRRSASRKIVHQLVIVHGLSLVGVYCAVFTNNILLVVRLFGVW